MVKKRKKEVIEIANISETEFTPMFRDNFKRYGKYTIEYRALPDVRDGLKPVYRRILYRMGEIKLTSDKKPIKVAKITGDVIGLYHPHGDTAVEDALAYLSVPWKHTMPPISIKGNLGSVFGDTHAAGRYIEAKLTKTGDAYVRNLKPGIVEYEPNYDETAQIAKVLPAGLPYLLINGDDGIATGFRSSIPTHNPIEVITAFIAYVKNQKISQEQLLEIMPGPDFPTAGEIINKDDLAEIYETGKGKIIVRGKVRYEPKTNSLHIYEIPFTASGAMDTMVEAITKSTMEVIKIKNGKKVIEPPKYPWATNVTNYSGKDGIDITIELKPGVNPDVAMQDLFAKTPLESTFTYQFNALNDGYLSQYSLKRYFKEYLAFQHELLINENKIRLGEISKRLEVIKGLIILQGVVDEVIASAKVSNGKSELREVLMTGKILDGVLKKFHKTIKNFSFSEVQAEHISNLPIYKINKMDNQELVREGQQLEKEQKRIEALINDPRKRKQAIIKRHESELKNLDPKEFGRKTAIINADRATAVEIKTPTVPLFISMDKYGYVKISETNIENSHQTTNKEKIVAIAKNGIVYSYYLDNYKPTTGRGTLINQLLSVDDSIVGISVNVDKPKRRGLFVFKDGNVKTAELSRYQTKQKRFKVEKDKSEYDLVAYIDIPEKAKTVTINGKVFTINKLAKNGHGRNEFSKGVTSVDIKFDTKDTIEDLGNDGLVIFDGSDQVRYDWQTIDTKQYSAMYVVKYSDLLTQDVLFVHDDGTAKIVEGKQFEVKTKRTQIQGNKKGTNAIYIGPVPETLLGTYDDGKQKRIDTALLSHQSKVGGGARAFYSKKSKIVKVEDGHKSKLKLSTLAQQPK